MGVLRALGVLRSLVFGRKAGMEGREWCPSSFSMVRAWVVVADMERERSCVVRSLRRPAGRGSVRDDSEERREVEGPAVDEFEWSAQVEDAGEWVSVSGMAFWVTAVSSWRG